MTEGTVCAVPSVKANDPKEGSVAFGVGSPVPPKGP